MAEVCLGESWCRAADNYVRWELFEVPFSARKEEFTYETYTHKTVPPLTESLSLSLEIWGHIQQKYPVFIKREFFNFILSSSSTAFPVRFKLFLNMQGLLFNANAMKVHGTRPSSGGDAADWFLTGLSDETVALP